MEELPKEEVMDQPKKEDRRWCVYKHTCKHNGKVYIGITNKIKNRWSNNGARYKDKNLDGSYQQPAFANALDKYSDWNNDWVHEVLFDGLTHTEACEKEVELIALYRSNIGRWHDDANGYNMTDGGDGSYGHKLTDKTKALIGAKSKERWQDPIYRQHMIDNRPDFSGELNPMYGVRKFGEENPNYGCGDTVIQFDKNGEYVCEYVSIAQAENATGIHRANIFKCCRGDILSTGNFMWRFAKNCNTIKIEPYKNSKLTQIVQLDKSGNYIAEYDNASIANRETKIDSSAIIKCCKYTPKYKTAGGFRWMYKEDYEKQLKEQAIQND